MPARTAFAIKYHQALRFYPDSEAGYEYPDVYRRNDDSPVAHMWRTIANPDAPL